MSDDVPPSNTLQTGEWNLSTRTAAIDLASLEVTAVTLGKAESEEARAEQLENRRANHKEALRQRRWLFNILMPGLLALFLVLTKEALWSTGDPQRTAAELLKLLLPPTLTFLMGRASGERAAERT